MKVLENYGLGINQSDIDFVNLHVNKDNKLFIDPRLILRGDTQFHRHMRINIDAFMAELIPAIQNDNKPTISKLFEGVSEPNETRLGYSGGRIKGNSIGRDLRDALILGMRRSMASQAGILEKMYRVRLFVENIGPDRISDLLTKICKDPLIQFTQNQCEKHNIPTSNTNQRGVFQVKPTIDWVNQKVELPQYNGQSLILVPKNIVREEGAATGDVGVLYRYALRRILADNNKLATAVQGTGKKGKLLIRDLKRDYPNVKDLLNKAIIHDSLLMADFEDEIIPDRVSPLTDNQLDNIIGN